MLFIFINIILTNNTLEKRVYLPPRMIGSLGYDFGPITKQPVL